MGIIKRQSLKQSVILYFGVILGAINTLFIYPFALTTEELGLFRFIIDTATLISPFICLGINQLPVKFFPVFKNESNGHNGLLFNLLLSFFIGFLAFLVFVFLNKNWILGLFDKKSPLFQEYLIYVLPLAGFTILGSYLSQYTWNFKRVAIPEIFNNLYIKIAIPLGALLYFFDYISLTQAVWVILSSYFLRIISFYFYIKILGQWKLKPNFSFLKRPLLKEMSTYAFYGMMGSIGTILALQLDVFMVSVLSEGELSDTGVYTIALFISNVVMIPSKAITAIAAPIISQSWTKNNTQKIQNIYQKSSLNGLIAGIFLMICIWLSIDDLFRIMPNGERYDGGKYVVLILGLTKLFDMATSVNQHVIGYSKYFRFNFYAVLILAILNIFSNYIFIPIYQINGAALATMISLCLYNLAKFLFIKYKMNMQPFSWATLKVLILGIVTYLIAMWVPPLDNPFIDIILRSVVIVVLYFVPLLYFNLSHDITALFWQVMNKIKNKLS